MTGLLSRTFTFFRDLAESVKPCSMPDSMTSSRDDEWGGIFCDKDIKTASDVILKDQLITDASLGVKRPIKSEHSYSMLVTSPPPSPDDNQQILNLYSPSTIHHLSQLHWFQNIKTVGLQNKIDEMDEECYPAISMNTASGRDSLNSLKNNININNNSNNNNIILSSPLVNKKSPPSPLPTELEELIIKGEPVSEPSSPAPDCLNLEYIDDTNKLDAMISPHSIHFNDVKTLQNRNELEEELYERIDIPFGNHDTGKIVNRRGSNRGLPPTPPSSASSDSEGLPSASSSPQHGYSQNSIIGQNINAYPYPRLYVSTNRQSGRHPIQTDLISTQLKGATGPLILTEEEIRTFRNEGYDIPEKMPLTKIQEKLLKKIRRKIKNKISAQESRRKKKEYMDDLERKVKYLSNENSSYQNRLKKLETTNNDLLKELKRLQELVGGQ
ncbi:cyclic AMP response element-binding protein A-like isoform X2 [Aphidius gifuensis]|uniref:cyclic AMP response element-binding protein A-like isoform X2 n=1 Tax=Aphidius gifuensis TaxID=684658 RepID=UPI001CDC7CC1|nr:cyclic AMP response element-binding protein A-like isoform X2 [Aphidius gifuensis]